MVKKEKESKNFSLLVYVSIIMATIGVVWLAVNQVAAGIIFMSLYLTSIGSVVLSLFFLRTNDIGNLKAFIKSPFTTKLPLDAGLWVLGWTIAVVIKMIGGLVGSGFSLTAIQVPLAAQTVNQGVTQVFAAAQATQNPFWNWFITVFVAGTLEEFIFAFVTMIVFFIIGKFLLSLILKRPIGESFVPGLVAFALLASVFLFAGAHGLNASYTTLSLFLFAAVFRGIMNAAIYYGGFFMSFSIGLHQANNAIWFYESYGSAATLTALFSWGGLIIALFFTLILFYVFRNFGEIIYEVRKVIT